MIARTSDNLCALFDAKTKTINHQLPITNHQSPITNHQSLPYPRLASSQHA
jgi:hypothetical protein